MDISKQLLSRTEAAGTLGVSVQTLNRIIARGELEVKRIGKHVRIPADKLSEYINSSAKKGGGNEQ